MLITNVASHGGDLSLYFFKQLGSPKTERLVILAAYVGKEYVDRLTEELEDNKKVAVELLVGMAAKEGLTQQTYDALCYLHERLKSRKHPKFLRQGVYIYFSGKNGERSRGMHAKVYLFDQGTSRQLIVGSSNFSFSGFEPNGNVEANLVNSDGAALRRFDIFLKDLHSANHAVPIDLIQDFPIRGRAGQTRRRSMVSLQRVAKPKSFMGLRYVDLDLARNIDQQTRSNLNCCFGKGRWSRITGVVVPRDWYEVELISPTNVTSSPHYPRGHFDVITSDGFAFKAVTNGDYFKNLRSAEDLKILGLWLKGALEDAGSLSDDPQEIVTSQTFRNYGNSILRIYRPDRHAAILHFPREPKDL
jgi:hypothetical protein